MTAEQLLPCPFCASEDFDEVIGVYGHGIECIMCHASSGQYKNETLANAAWNRRAHLSNAAAEAPLGASEGTSSRLPPGETTTPLVAAPINAGAPSDEVDGGISTLKFPRDTVFEVAVDIHKDGRIIPAPDIAPDAPTLETDAEVIRRNYGYDRIPADFARNLERQRNAVQAAIDAAGAELPFPKTSGSGWMIHAADFNANHDAATLAIAKERQLREAAEAEIEIFKKRYVTKFAYEIVAAAWEESKAQLAAANDACKAWYSAASPFATPEALREGIAAARADAFAECARICRATVNVKADGAMQSVNLFRHFGNELCAEAIEAAAGKEG